MPRYLLICAALLGGGAYNLNLYSTDEGVNISGIVRYDGWQIDCRYYTPVRLFTVQIDSARTCPTRIKAR
jgi:hypothetical protein